MAVLKPLCVLFAAVTYFANGQVDLMQNRRTRPTTFGVFDGQIVQMDETLAPARGQSSQFGDRLGQQRQESSRRGSARGLNFRNVKVAGQLPLSLGRDKNERPARLSARNVLGRPLGSALSLPTASDLRLCPLTSCSAQFIPQRCRYTPVEVGSRGNYCLGCPEDICPRAGRHALRRVSRIRRLLCRILGICFGEHYSLIPDYPGNDVV